MMDTHWTFTVAVLFILSLFGSPITYSEAVNNAEYRDAVKLADGLVAPDTYTLQSSKSFLSGYEALNSDGTVNVVVEIPAGTSAKWEVSKPKGELIWTFKKGEPRVVDYLAYPANYGMIPKTLLPKRQGGDGDPLDVLVLGPSVERGSVVKASVIGVLQLLDDGEQDDKLIAVMTDTSMSHVKTLRELDRDYMGVSLIVELWFKNYKGPGEIQSKGYADQKTANAVLQAAIKAYSASN